MVEGAIKQPCKSYKPLRRPPASAWHAAISAFEQHCSCKHSSWYPRRTKCGIQSIASFSGANRNNCLKPSFVWSHGNCFDLFRQLQSQMPFARSFIDIQHLSHQKRCYMPFDTHSCGSSMNLWMQCTASYRQKTCTYLKPKALLDGVKRVKPLSTRHSVASDRRCLNSAFLHQLQEFTSRLPCRNLKDAT